MINQDWYDHYIEPVFKRIDEEEDTSEKMGKWFRGQAMIKCAELYGIPLSEVYNGVTHNTRYSIRSLQKMTKMVKDYPIIEEFLEKTQGIPYRKIVNPHLLEHDKSCNHEKVKLYCTTCGKKLDLDCEKCGRRKDE